MKQIFTTLIIMTFAGNASSQIISQNQIPNTVHNQNSIACDAGLTATGENSYIRSFNLQDFGITSDFTITNVAFGVDRVLSTFPVTVKLYNVTGTFPNGVFPGPSLTLLGSTGVVVSPANNLSMVNTGTGLTTVVPAGGGFVVEINHNGKDDTPQQFFAMGTHPGTQSGPSYLVGPACNITTPTATGTGPLANFPLARWVMTVTGHTTALGVTEVINSPDIQIFPNPVKDVLKFRFNNNLKSEAIDIYDMNGRVITSIQNNKNVNEVDMSAYPKGHYILKVKADDGKLYVEKIIKE